MFPLLFKPIRIRDLELKNRLVMPCMGTLFSYDRRLNERHFLFYERRARGGVGLIVAGPVGVDLLGSGVIALSLDEDRYIPDYKELADRIHRNGSLVFIQLFHAGRYSHSMMIGGEKAIAPSAVKSKYTGETPREMRLEDIKKVRDAFAQAAGRAKEVGLDGIEIIASAGYLLSQFLSPITNLREDEYGGSFEDRMRFPREVLEGVRRAVGEGFPVIVRVAGNDFMKGGNTNKQWADICKELVKTGIDAINVTGGWHETFVPQLPMEVPRGAYAYLARGIKEVVDIPVISSNRYTDPFTAERVIKDHMADMIALGRVLVADPDWPIKAEEGHVDEIRPCVGCMQGCLDKIFTGQSLECMVNPEAGREKDRSIQRDFRARKLVVIGAGPAGMEAAYRAHQAGCDVDLYEREEDIGGQLTLAGRPPGRGEYIKLREYYRAVLRKAGVSMHTKVSVNADMIRDLQADDVIVAVGASPLIPDVPGVNGKNVVNAWELLRFDPEIGDKVVVVGGGAVGLETAMFIARKGTISPEVLEFLLFYGAETDEELHRLITRGTKEVTVIEMLNAAGKDIGKTSRWVILKSLKILGVTIKTGVKLLRIDNEGVVVEEGGQQNTIPCDTVVLAMGAVSNKGLTEKLKGARIPFNLIGDAKSPRKVFDAIHEGYAAIQSIMSEK